MKVGCVPYLHYEPFYFDMARRGIELVEKVPSAMAAAVEHGEIDAGPIPLVDSLRLEDQFDVVSGFGVSSLKGTGHAFLYANAPLAELGGARIAMTDEAATAPSLVHILLTLQHQAEPATYVTLDEPHDAFVLIGHRGLRQRRGARDFSQMFDLGEAWQGWTGLPFVASRWMARRDLEPAERALLEDTLYVGLEDGVNAVYLIAEPREDVLMLPRDVVRFSQGFRYFMRMPEQKSVEQFGAYLKAAGPPPGA